MKRILEEEKLDSGALIIKRRSNNFGGHDRVGHRSLRFSTTPWSTVPFIKQEECFKLAHAQFLTAVVRLRYQIFSAVRNYKASTVLYGFIRDATRLRREIRRDNEMKMIDLTTEYERLVCIQSHKFLSVYIWNIILLIRRFVFVLVSPSRFIDFTIAVSEQKTKISLTSKLEYSRANCFLSFSFKEDNLG